MERIGIYGGTFNPPHVGHMQGAEQAIRTLGLDRLLLIPVRVAPHKTLPPNSPTAEQRLEMLRIAAGDRPNIAVSDMELCRQGVSYSYETVLALKNAHPQARLVLVMGSDMFLSFQTWCQPGIILENAEIAVLYRGDRDESEAVEEQKKILEARGGRITLVQNKVLTISSTQLRRLLAFRCADAFLPEGVGDYIRRNGLYDTGANWKNLPMDRLEQVVTGLLKPNRVAHVLGCRDTAVELAGYWGEDQTDAARAGLLHDITKALDGPLQLTLCDAYGKILDDFSRETPKTLHAMTGALVTERIFGENPKIVSAIRWHTTGRAHMTLLEKIIYIADYMEPNRDFPGVDRLRHLAFTDLDAALRLGLEMTVDHVQSQGNQVSPESRDALDWLAYKKG